MAETVEKVTDDAVTFNQAEDVIPIDTVKKNRILTLSTPKNS